MLWCPSRRFQEEKVATCEPTIPHHPITPSPHHPRQEAAFMRYRRLSYRYALVLATGQDWSVDAPRLAESAGVRFAKTYWRPEADVCESDSAIVVTADLAGIDPDTLD